MFEQDVAFNINKTNESSNINSNKVNFVQFIILYWKKVCLLLRLGNFNIWSFCIIDINAVSVFIQNIQF